MLIILFLVSHSNFLFVPRGRLSWLPVSFLLHVKYPLSYRIVTVISLGSKGQISRWQEAEVTFGGLAEASFLTAWVE